MTNVQLASLTRDKAVNTYETGQIIFYEGNAPFGIYCVSSGRVKLHKTGRRGKQQVIRVLGPGDIFGYRALLSNEVFSSTAEAIEPCRICVISRQTLFSLLEESHGLALQFMARLGRELGAAEDQLVQQAQDTVQQRTARLLLLLLAGSTSELKESSKIEIPFRRKEMAEMIGTSSETFIRTLQYFGKRGLIKVEGSAIHLKNIPNLRVLAHGSPYQD